MKKKILSLIICIVTVISFTGVSASAAEIAGIKTDFPNITATVKTKPGEYEKVDASKVKATLDGKQLNINSAENSVKSNEWIVLVDTSKSTKAFFDAEKDAIVSINKSLGKNDKLSLYTFDTSVKKVLDGTEKPEDAEKKIKAIQCNGEDTVFFESVDKILDFAKSSKADNVIPVIFTDGVDTISKSVDKKSVSDKLSKSGIPVYGFYANSLKPETAKSFSDLMKLSGGSAEAFTSENIKDKLSKKSGGDDIVVSAELPESIDANDKAVLSIDLGDGKTITKETKVSSWTAETTSAAAATEATTETATGTVTEAVSEAIAPVTTDNVQTTAPSVNDDGNSVLKYLPIIIAVIVLLLVLILVISKTKKKSNDKDKENDKLEKAKLKAEEKADALAEKQKAAENKAVLEERERKSAERIAANEEKKIAEAKAKEQELKKEKADEKAKADAAKKKKSEIKKEESKFTFYFVDKDKK